MLEIRNVRKFYKSYPRRLRRVRERLRRPLTLAEKILYAHLTDPAGQEPARGKSYLQLNPDRVAMQDVTAQMAILQFISSGRPRVAVPTTVHLDHLVVARLGAAADLPAALEENREVYEFLACAARKYGMGLWKPGAGIIHQTILECYAFPGGLLIGADSHTPNAGGMAMLAMGVGGADAVDAMVGLPWELLCPQLIGVRLSGALRGWASPKDVIVKLCGLLKCAGATNRIIEYFGPGAESLSLTGRATIANMGAEVGATASIFPFDARAEAYLRATRRQAVAEAARAVSAELRADPEVLADPANHFDQVIEVDLDRVEPLIAGPDTPDSVRTTAELKEALAAHSWPDQVKVGIIGSCTNSSYEDIGRAAHVARQAAARGLRCAAPLLVAPGSAQVCATLERDGLLEDLRRIGATVLANACGPCIGQWKREDLKPDEMREGKPNVILTSFNRNFRGRNDGLPGTLAFIASPEVVMAKTIAGRLSFDPAGEALQSPRGEQARLDPPAWPDLPERGFAFDDSGYQPPAAKGASVKLRIAPGSERLQLLEPFPPWDGRDILDARVLVKAGGKCTTDQISPAGKWLRYRGHLDRLSDNMFLGAVNAFTGQAGVGTNLRTGPAGRPLAEIARDYKAHAIPWVVVGDANYGEGSSREHAALEPRYLGGRAVIARSFARIHETNLKKQGVLALTFADPTDYDKLRQDDLVDIGDLKSFTPDAPLQMVLKHADGSSDRCELRHSYSAEQIEWFKAGSALNVIRKRAAAAKRRVTMKARRTKRKPARKKRARGRAVGNRKSRIG